MFLHFYKLVFLGTKFAEKVLQIKLKNQEEKVVLEEETKKETTESVFIDTSEISEPDFKAQNENSSAHSQEPPGE